MSLNYSQSKVIGARVFELLLYLFLPLLSRRRDATSKKILLIEPYGMGDLVLLTALLAPLREEHPDAVIGVVCHSQWRELLEKHPRIDKVHHHDFFWSNRKKPLTIGRLVRLLKFCLQLRREKYDAAFDIRGDIRSVFLMVIAGCSKRAGFLDYMGSNITSRGLLLTNATACGLRPRLDELSSLLECAGIRPRAPLFIDLGVTPERPEIHRIPKSGLHVAAGWKYRRWKTARWAQLVSELSLREYEIILLGSSGEQPELAEINALSAQACRQIETKDTQSLINKIGELDLLICLDSGPAHIAAGCRVPTVVLFGPGATVRWGSINRRTLNIHHQEEYPCAPCAQIECVRPDYNCMDRIEVGEVLAAVESILQEQRPAAAR